MTCTFLPDKSTNIRGEKAAAEIISEGVPVNEPVARQSGPSNPRVQLKVASQSVTIWNEHQGCVADAYQFDDTAAEECTCKKITASCEGILFHVRKQNRRLLEH